LTINQEPDTIHVLNQLTELAMFTVVKQKVNSSGLRARLGMAPDLIQARIMNGNLVVDIVEGSVEQEKLVDKIVNEKIKELS